MAVDIIEAKPTEFRGRQVECLAAGLMFAAFGLAPYPNLHPEVGYLDLWWVRLALLVVASPFFVVASGLLRPITLPVLEIGRDAIRYTSGAQEHTIARAGVTKAQVFGGNLFIFSAVGDRTAEIVLRAFDLQAVRAALSKHGWTEG